MRRPFSHTAARLALPLLLLPVACKKQPPLTDDALATAVQGRIQADGALASEPIQTGVQNGVVTLTGSVSSPAARSLAASDAAAVTGVHTVVNNLTVNTPAPVQASVPPPSTEAAPPPTSASSRELRREQAREQAREKRQATPNVTSGRNSTTAGQGPAVAQTAPPPVQQAPAPVVEAPPPPPPAPVVRNVTVPSGTVLPVRITQTLDSATTQQGDTFSGSLSSDLVIDGATVLRQGSNVSGRVTAVQEAAHFKGNSLLSVELTGVTRRGDRIALTTDPYSVEGKGRGKNTLEKTGGGAAVGAILGGIFGGGKGAAIGAAAGGGAGAGVNGITRGQQVQIPAESLVRFRLASPFSVKVTDNNSGAATSPSAASSAGNGADGRRPLPQ